MRCRGRRELILVLLSSTAALPVAGQDCSEWNTQPFFAQAEPPVRECLLAGADVLARDESGWTPLHFAAALNDPGISGLLLEHGADVLARDENDWTPLHWAAYANTNPSVISVLNSLNADVGARDANDWTPLHWAALNNQEPGIIHALHQAGADLETRDYLGGWTPLHLAAVWENREAFGALLAAGADAGTRDVDRRTAWDYIAKEDRSAYREQPSRSLASVGQNDSQPVTRCE